MRKIQSGRRELRLADQAAAQAQSVLQARIDELEGEKRALSGLNTGLVAAKQAKEAEIRKIREHDGALERCIHALKEHADAEISKLVKRNSDVTEEKRALDQQAGEVLQSMHVEISKLKEQNSALAVDVSALREKVGAGTKSHEAAISKLKEQSSTLAEENQELHEQARVDERAREAKAAVLAKEKGELHEQVRTLREELEAAKKAKDIAAAPKVSPFLPRLTTPRPLLAAGALPTPVSAGALGSTRLSFGSPSSWMPTTPASAEQHKTAHTFAPRQAFSPASSGRATQERADELRTLSSGEPMALADGSDYESDGEHMDDSDDEPMGEAESTPAPSVTDGRPMEMDDSELMGGMSAAAAQPVISMLGNHPVTKPVVDDTIEMADVDLDAALDAIIREPLKKRPANNLTQSSERPDPELVKSLEEIARKPAGINASDRRDPRASRQVAGGSSSRARANGMARRPAESSSARPRRSAGVLPSQRPAQQHASTRDAGRRQQQPREGRISRPGKAPQRRTTRGGGCQPQVEDDADDEDADDENVPDYGISKYGPPPPQGTGIPKVPPQLQRFRGEREPLAARDVEENSYAASRDQEAQKRQNRENRVGRGQSISQSILEESDDD